MKREAYIKTTDFFRKPGWPAFLIFFMSRVIPVLIGNIYIILCVLFLLTMPPVLFRFMGVPLFGFIAVTLLRSLIHKKRPYEALDFKPIHYKTTLKSGKSFPSRHTASAALIAMAVFAYLPVPGLVLLFMAALVALSRVLSGMHYIADVIAGLAFGIIVGLIGFYPVIF